MTIDDETLTAYIDGELSADRMAEITAHLENSPELAKRAERMRLADKLFTQASHAIDSKPMPAEILTMLEAFPENKDKSAEDQKITRLPFKGQQTVSRAPVWQMAMAASVALFIGLGAGRGLMTPSTSETAPQVILAQQTAGIIGPGNALFDILEKQPGTSPVAINGTGNTTVTPIMTFRSGDTYCREFDVMTAGSSTRNIACRTENTWIVKLSVGADGHMPSDNSQYQTASQADNPVITAMILDLIDGDALDAGHEAEIIRQNWQSD